MQTNVIITENSWRLEKFQTKTILDTENGHQVIRRCPITETALPFISIIADREKASREYLKNHFDVLCGVLQDGCLKYDYLPYQSLLQIIEMQFQQDSPSMADKTIKAYVDKIKALQSIYTVPKEFYQIIGLNGAYDDTKLLCLCRGLLDLTPRNILVNGERWIAIDFEWSFDFPIPVAFVLFRAIKETVTNLQYEIRRHTGKTRPTVGIFARGLRTYYFPQDWVKYISVSNISFAQMLRWELGFCRYITGTSKGTVGRIKLNPRTKTRFSSWSLKRHVRTVERPNRFLRKLPGLRKLAHFFERVLLYLQK
ncbi:MAG: hypothetical protein NTX52_00610 [Planctomycetota bacterium]|nr:hypothetical protein [Planctomycetota bacterium]